ncbi:uncharacterized protein LY79DRAFT_567857, partial [Colletotrichum navitas]
MRPHEAFLAMLALASYLGVCRACLRMEPGRGTGLGHRCLPMPSRRAFSSFQRTAEACLSERPDDGGRAGKGLVLNAATSTPNLQSPTVCLLATRRGSVLDLGGRGGAGGGKRSRDGRSRAGVTASYV